MIAEQQARVDNHFTAIEAGEFSQALVARLNTVQADQMTSQREAATPALVELPDDLLALYQAHVEDLVGFCQTRRKHAIGAACLPLVADLILRRY